MTNKKKHIHQYYKAYPYGHAVGPLGKIRYVWACGLADCNHIIPGNMPEPLDKASLCNNCMEVLVLDRENMTQDKPICDRCANPSGITITHDFDLERHMAKSRINKNTGKSFEEITDTEIDRMIGYMRLESLNQKK